MSTPNEEQQIGKLLGMPESRRTYEGTRLLALQKCFTGLEFEAEEVKSRLPVDQEEAGYWVEKEDNSLRNNGMEYVLREPLFGEDLLSSMKWICEWGTKERLGTNFRTGLHVHIDVRNLGPSELLSMIIYYALFEKVIFDWVGDDRDGNIFCMPFYKAEGVLEPIVTALRAGNKIKDAAKAIDRYAAFNLNSLSKFGTVEFRHLKTTFNYERVLKWVNICQAFKKYAKNNPLKPHELVAEMSKLGPANMFAAILGPALSSELWSNKSQEQVETVGIPIAQEIATLLDGSAGLAWDSVRTALGNGGENPKWNKWAAKIKLKKPESIENLFADPAILLDKDLQNEAVNTLHTLIREKLETTLFSVAKPLVV